MTAADVFTLLKNYYEETGKIMSRSLFEQEVLTKAKAVTAMTGILQFSSWLDEQREDQTA